MISKLVRKRPNFGMPNRWVRLIAWFALATFLVADGTAVAHHFLPFSGCQCSHRSYRPSKGISPPASPSSTCKHCCKKQKLRVADRGSQSRDDTEVGSACPCERRNPAKPSCPCPGGCPYCSVAKVPHAASTIFSPEPASYAGRCLSEFPLLYLPPFSGTLSHPPRA